MDLFTSQPLKNKQMTKVLTSFLTQYHIFFYPFDFLFFISKIYEIKRFKCQGTPAILKVGQLRLCNPLSESTKFPP